jgi:predicted enzyme related to lactoylglutathione lyase
MLPLRRGSRASYGGVTKRVLRCVEDWRSTLGLTITGEDDMPGNLVHFELLTKDANRAKRFYSTLLGWKFKDSDMPGVEYYLIEGIEPTGGLNPLQDAPGPVVYFDTDDIDASIGKVRELGGKADEKMAIPRMGWFAGCTDTEGNKFSLFQNDPSVTMETEQQTARA